MEGRQQLHELETHKSAPESRDTALLILAGQKLSLLTSARGSPWGSACSGSGACQLDPLQPSAGVGGTGAQGRDDPH